MGKVWEILRHPAPSYRKSKDHGHIVLPLAVWHISLILIWWYQDQSCCLGSRSNNKVTRFKKWQFSEALVFYKHSLFINGFSFCLIEETSCYIEREENATVAAAPDHRVHATSTKNCAVSKLFIFRHFYFCPGQCCERDIGATSSRWCIWVHASVHPDLSGP